MAKVNYFIYCLAFLSLSVSLESCNEDKDKSIYHSGSQGSSKGSNSFPKAAQVDAEVNLIMQKTGATAVTFAEIEHGKLRYEKAYGYKNLNHTIALRADALMRTASNVKPVTAAAIHQLARSGQLKLSDHAYCTGDNQPCWLSKNFISATTDARIKDITIQHLIAHKGGFTRDSDPFGYEFLCKDLNLECPLKRADIVTYMLAQSLDFAPGDSGTLDGYSNFGYMVLGMIVEQASGIRFIDYAQKMVVNPIGIEDENFKVAHALPQERDAREPNYISTQQTLSAYDPDKTIAFEDGGFVSDNWISVGSCLTTAKSLATFASNYALPYGEKLTSYPQQDGAHWGRMDGISSIVRQLDSGKSYAIFLNISLEFSDFTDLQTQLDLIVR